MILLDLYPEICTERGKMLEQKKRKLENILEHTARIKRTSEMEFVVHSKIENGGSLGL